MTTLIRCAWAANDPLMRAYHDEEWGRPVHDSRALWEKLMLDGFQAGLSWLIVLRKREALRRAFQCFEPETVSRFNQSDIDRLMTDASIIRSRAKIEATVSNAKAYLAMQSAGEDFSRFVWGFVGGTPIDKGGEARIAQSAESAALASALKKRGFKFAGPVIVYAWMQACGLVNDHEASCFCRTNRRGAE